MKIVVKSPTGASYEARNLLGETKLFRLYECILPDGRIGMLKIAASTDSNSLLDREACILDMMREEAQLTEDAFHKNVDSEKNLNYHFCFPNLVETFICHDQKNKRINILTFFDISEKLSDLVPISHIAERDHVRIDPRTSGWILGKLLKLLVFTHGMGIYIGDLTSENIIINREQHYVAIADWTKASIRKSTSESIRSEEISQVTKEVVSILCGNPDTGELLPDDQLVDNRYAELLGKFILKKENDATEAHRKFYELIRSLWPTGFHKFNTYNL